MDEIPMSHNILHSNKESQSSISMATVDSNSNNKIVSNHDKYKEEEEEIEFESLLEDLDNTPTNPVSKFLELVKSKTSMGSRDDNSNFTTVRSIVLFLLFHVYLMFAVIHHVQSDDYLVDFGWCSGLGFLLICTGLWYSGVIYYKIIKGRVKMPQGIKESLNHKYVQYCISLFCFLALVAFLIYDTRGETKRLISAFGVIIILGIGVLLSKFPGRINWRIVIWGMGMQFVIALLILRWTTGRLILECLSDKITGLLHFVLEGSSFVYGYLASGLKIPMANGTYYEVAGVFAFKAITSCYLFTFLIEILYYYDVMTWIVATMGWALEATVGCTAVESMTVAANIFLGMTTAPLVVRPYVGRMTNSELHTMMTGGFATIAGAAFGAFVAYGINGFHLLAASVMSAPASLVYAKILLPETKRSITSSEEVYAYKPKKTGNAIDAGVRGAIQAVFLIANICAGIIAILGAVALCNHVVNWLGILVGLENLSFEWIVGKMFYPLAWAMGVDNEEIDQVASLLGTKTIINEFVAYIQLSKMCLSPRSKTIATYALCCFANLGSIGVTLGGVTAICPERSKDASKVVMSAFIAGNAAALLTACVAGALSTDQGYAEWSLTANCTLPE